MFTLAPPTLLKFTPLNFVSLPQPYQGQFVLANILGCVAIHKSMVNFSEAIYSLGPSSPSSSKKFTHTPPHVCLNICTCTTCMPGLTKAKIRHWIPWNWDYRWLWVLGTKSEVLEPLSHLTSHDQSLGPLLVISKEVEYISVQTHNVASN